MRTANRVVVVPEDEPRLDSGEEAQRALGVDVGTGIVLTVRRLHDRCGGRRCDEHGLDHRPLHAPSEENLGGQGRAVGIDELKPDERVATDAAQHRLLGNDDLRSRGDAGRELHVLLTGVHIPVHIVPENQRYRDAAQRQRGFKRDLGSGAVAAVVDIDRGPQFDGHRSRRAHLDRGERGRRHAEARQNQTEQYRQYLVHSNLSQVRKFVRCLPASSGAPLGAEDLLSLPRAAQRRAPVDGGYDDQDGRGSRGMQSSRKSWSAQRPRRWIAVRAAWQTSPVRQTNGPSGSKWRAWP